MSPHSAHHHAHTRLDAHIDSRIEARVDHPYSLLRLPEALTCWPALAVLAASFLVAALVFALGGLMGRLWLGFMLLFSLVAVVVCLAGISGAGTCLSDLAHRRPYRSLTSYFLAGLLCLPKLLGAVLLMTVAVVLLFVGLALVFVVCKIPLLGPLMLVVAVPVAVLLVAALMMALYVASSIVGPALWDGERVMHALSIAWHIARHHPLAAIGKIVGGMLLSAIFASVLFGLLASASALVGGLAASVIGFGTQAHPLYMMDGAFSGHMMGTGVGFSLVFALASALVFLLPLMVGVLTWCEFSALVDLDSIRQAADEKLQDVNTKMADLKDKAQAYGASDKAAASYPAEPAPAAQTGPASAAAAAPASPAATPPALPLPAPEPMSDPASSPTAQAAAAQATTCPQCHSAVQPTDRFCQQCGKSLQGPQA